MIWDNIFSVLCPLLFLFTGIRFALLSGGFPWQILLSLTFIFTIDTPSLIPLYFYFCLRIFFPEDSIDFCSSSSLFCFYYYFLLYLHIWLYSCGSTQIAFFKLNLINTYCIPSHNPMPSILRNVVSYLQSFKILLEKVTEKGKIFNLLIVLYFSWRSACVEMRTCLS